MEDEAATKASRTLLALDDEEDASLHFAGGETNLQETWNNGDLMDGEDEMEELRDRVKRRRAKELEMQEEEYQELHRVYSKAVKRSFRNMKRFPEPSVGAMWTEADAEAFDDYEANVRAHHRNTVPFHTDPNDQKHHEDQHLLSGEETPAPPPDGSAPPGYPQLRYSLGVYDEHMFVGDARGETGDDDEDYDDDDDDDTTATSATINRRRSWCAYAEEDDDDFVEGQMVCEATPSSMLSRLPPRTSGRETLPTASVSASPPVLEPKPPRPPCSVPMPNSAQGSNGCSSTHSATQSSITKLSATSAQSAAMMAALAEHRGGRSKFLRRMRQRLESDEEEEE